MHLIIVQLRFLVDFQMSKILAQSIFSIGRPHNDTRINAFNVSSFNRNFAITLHPTLFGKSTFTYSCVLPSRSCSQCRVEVAGVIGIWKCMLECQDWSPPMYLLQIAAILFCDRHFLERPSL